MFAPGWFQDIATTSEEDEKRDLLIYISDTHKSIYGVRYNGYSMEDSIEVLRRGAESIQEDLLDEIKWEHFTDLSSLRVQFVPMCYNYY